MTYQETLSQFLILGAALCKHVPTNDLESSQQTIVRDELLYNVEFATQMKSLFKTNMVFESENQGVIPTVKGWKSLQPRVIEKIVKQMVVKPVEKMTDAEILNTWVETGFGICHRLPTGKLMQKQFRNQYADVVSVIECVTGTSNNVLFPSEEEVVEEVATLTEA